jgi:hypothetical protein
MELIEQLDGIVWRDQRNPAGFDAAEDQRKALHGSAKVIRDEAAKRRPDLRRLRVALQNFQRAIDPSSWSAVMLNEVFDIPFVPSTATEAPELFDPLRKAMAARDDLGSMTPADLEALSALPVRARLRTNKVRNHALEQALIVCRKYWLQHSPKLGWSRSALNHPETLKSYAPSDLVGPCERFVVDMLTAAGIQFTLSTLNGAWSALDKRRAKQR